MFRSTLSKNAPAKETVAIGSRRSNARSNSFLIPRTCSNPSCGTMRLTAFSTKAWLTPRPNIAASKEVEKNSRKNFCFSISESKCSSSIRSMMQSVTYDEYPLIDFSISTLLPPARFFSRSRSYQGRPPNTSLQQKHHRKVSPSPV